MPAPHDHQRTRLRLAGEVLGRAAREFRDDRCSQLAASISYHVLFSLFPLAIALTAGFGLVTRDAGVRHEAIDQVVTALPLTDHATERARTLLVDATGSGSRLGLLGLLGVAYAATGMMAALRAGVNAAFDVQETRPFLRGKLIDLGLVALAALAAIGSLGLIIFVHVVGNDPDADVRLDLTGGWASWLLGLLVPLAFAFAIVFGLYRWLPSRSDPRTSHAWPVALAVACLFVVAENLFAVYVGNFGDYNAIYGSLGAVIAFMFFVYLSASLMLFGAEVVSEWPRAEAAPAEDAGGPPQPLRRQLLRALRGLWVHEP